MYLCSSLIAFIGFQDLAYHNDVNTKLLLLNSILCGITIIVSGKQIFMEKDLTVQDIKDSIFQTDSIVFFVAYFIIQIIKMRAYFGD